MTSLYESLGGQAAVDAAVDVFYGRILADDHIAHFFEAVDMDRQKRKQRAFLTMAFGGPAKYDGLTMAKGHAHLLERGLDDSHVDHVAGHLEATLGELGVAKPLIEQVMTLVEAQRDAVLGRESVSS